MAGCIERWLECCTFLISAIDRSLNQPFFREMSRTYCTLITWRLIMILGGTRRGTRGPSLISLSFPIWKARQMVNRMTSQENAWLFMSFKQWKVGLHQHTFFFFLMLFFQASFDQSLFAIKMLSRISFVCLHSGSNSVSMTKLVTPWGAGFQQ